MMENWDLTDGVNPTEFCILDEMVFEEEETNNNNNAGCLAVLLLPILPAVLMEVFI